MSTGLDPSVLIGNVKTMKRVLPHKYTPVMFSCLLLIAVLAACGGAGDGEGKAAASRGGMGSRGAHGGPRGGRGGMPKEMKDRPTPKVPVIVASVARGDMEAFLDASSTLEAEDTIEIVSQATGIVVEVGAEEGDAVRKGRLLARLDYEELELAEERARTQFERLQQEHDRAEGLSREKLLSDEAFQKVRFDLRQAEIDWKQKSLELQRTRITSPISGTIAERLVRVGELKRANDPVYKIVDFRSLIAPVYIPEKYLGQLRKGQRVILGSPAFGERTVGGSVLRISPVVDSQSGTVRVVVRPDSFEDLRPGMFVTVQLVLDKHEGVMVIPKKALVYDDERPYAFVIENGEAQRRALRFGYQDESRAEISEGLETGEMIVLVGQAALKDGTKVAAEDEDGNPLQVEEKDEGGNPLRVEEKTEDAEAPSPDATDRDAAVGEDEQGGDETPESARPRRGKRRGGRRP